MPSPSFGRIRDRLPSLYRPQDGDTGLLVGWLQAAARTVDQLHLQESLVLQARWLDHADSALLSPFFLRSLALRQQPVPPSDDPGVLAFPWIDDLARLGALLGVLPWGGPPGVRETVEAYRLRLRRIVALYRDGLGTAGALRRMVEAQLPVDLTRPPGLRDRPFLVEEYAPVAMPPSRAPARGAPLDEVGPLMRWRLENRGLRRAAPTLYVEGLAASTAASATRNPLLELFATGDGSAVRLGIAYAGTVASGQTLRLRPAHASWLATAAGLGRALALPTEGAPSDPAAPGPWQSVPGAPAGTVTALRQGPDGTLWAALDAAGAGSLWRFDGAAWSQALAGLPAPHCLALDGTDLLAGTARGLLRLPLFPADGKLAPQPRPEALAGPAVHAIHRTADGAWWLGTDQGVAHLGAADALAPFGLDPGLGTATPVHAIHEDRLGTLYFGTELGVFQYQPGAKHWYWYAGKDHSAEVPGWQRLVPEAASLPERNFPAPELVFLPPVRSLFRASDATLWIGTDHGLARYNARSAGDLTYVTLLEAFPELGAGPVSAIAEDERGAVWFATGQGLLRFDGRDWWQGQAAGAQTRLARLAGGGQEALIFWRFDRGAGAWQHIDPAASSAVWIAAAGSLRITAEVAVLALLWTDQAVPDLGSWDGARFTPDPSAAPAALRMRFKPDETRAVDGGIPAVPRLPTGPSVWRYLALEAQGAPAPASRPAWTVEGRLLPPPDHAAPEEGRWSAAAGFALSAFDDAVFSYPPAARVWFAWEERRALSLAVHLETIAPGETIDPAVLDRVWQGIQQVRPAGARVRLTVDDDIKRGV